jgi:hypothetical protein
VAIEGSDDLREWRSLASRSALVRLQQGGQALVQDRVAVGAARVKYFRITWDGGNFALKSVEAEAAPEVKPPERRVTTAGSPTRTKDGDLVYDLGARLPVEAIRVVFPEPNTVALYEVAVRDGSGKDAPWRTISSGSFYRIVRDGVEIASPPLELRGRGAAREWRLRPQAKGGPEAFTPTLEALWIPAEIVFVAKGDGPFKLAFGDDQAKPVSIPIASLIPGYEKGAEKKLALAPVGAVQTAALHPSPARDLFGDIPPRKVALWAVLILAVVVLGFMAWRLMGQMKGSDP